ncbi:MAG: dihydroorotate dehydrogenase-like protein [Acidimicrobiia bacterium]|jgi:dihydroorotate dehydrogenase (fumarate)|nr:dihydroorotate dehydrogenase-like protein [Acidimicrobiia bacterium]
MIDLTTTYLGLELTSPLVASAGPLTGRLDTLERLAAAGAAAVVLPSLFEEDVVAGALERQQLFTRGTEAFAEALTYLPEPEGADELDRHLQLVADAKAHLDVPVIASLNGTTRGGWIRYASELVDAGADALELNVYGVGANPDDTATSLEVELLRLVRAVRDEISVPLAVKISPFFTAVSHFVGQVTAAGADGVVCFNRFYQPDLDLESLAVTPTLDLSTSAELRLPLRWVALLSGRVSCSLALSTGVHTPDDAVKALLAGADVVMATSSLLLHGPEHLGTLHRGLAAWLEDHEYESVAQARGSVSARSVPDPAAYERANYRQVLRRFTSTYDA